MPGESYYGSMPLAEQIQKFVDIHHAKRTRHISLYEASMLETAAARIRETLAIAREQALQELESVFEALSQAYNTVIFGDEAPTVTIQTFSTRDIAEPAQAIAEEGLRQLATDPNPVQVQAAVAALVLSQSADEFERRYAEFAADAKLVERTSTAEALAVVNRIVYLPTVVAENSWADISSLLQHLTKAGTQGSPVIIFGGTLVGTGNPVLAFVAGGSVIMLQLLNSFAEGMSPGLREFGDRWIRRKTRDDENGDPES